jgi:hypothetical protein
MVADLWRRLGTGYLSSRAALLAAYSKARSNTSQFVAPPYWAPAPGSTLLSISEQLASIQGSLNNAPDVSLPGVEYAHAALNAALQGFIQQAATSNQTSLVLAPSLLTNLSSTWAAAINFSSTLCPVKALYRNSLGLSLTPDSTTYGPSPASVPPPGGDVGASSSTGGGWRNSVHLPIVVSVVLGLAIILIAGEEGGS